MQSQRPDGMMLRPQNDALTRDQYHTPTAPGLTRATPRINTGPSTDQCVLLRGARTNPTKRLSKMGPPPVRMLRRNCLPWLNPSRTPSGQRSNSSRNLSLTFRLSTPSRPGGLPQPAPSIVMVVLSRMIKFSTCSPSRLRTCRTQLTLTIGKILHCRLLLFSCHARTPVPAPLRRSFLWPTRTLPP